MIRVGRLSSRNAPEHPRGPSLSAARSSGKNSQSHPVSLGRGIVDHLMVFRGDDEMHLQSFDDRGNTSRRWTEREKVPDA
jgi:hypothetical protein